MEIFHSQQFKEHYVTDLTWKVLDAFADTMFGNEGIKDLIADGGRLAVTYKNGSEVNIGVGPDFDEDTPVDTKAYSLAARAATAKRFLATTTLILIANKEIPGVGYAIGLVAGNVIFDESFKLKDVAAIHGKYKTYCESSARVFYVHGDVKHSSFALTHPYSLEELLAEKTGKKYKLTSLKNDKPLYLAITALIICVVLSAGYSAWDWYKTSLLKAEEDQRQLEGTPAYMYSESAKRLVASDQLIGASSGSDIVSQIGSFPVVLGGWSLQSIECVDLECRAKWLSEGGTYSDFKEKAHSDWSKLDFSAGEKDALGELKEIKHSFTINLKKSKLPPKSQWPTVEEYVYQTGVEWQKLKGIGWAAGLKSIEQQGIPPGVNAMSVRMHPDAVYAMPWVANNQDWWVARQVITKLKPNVVIQKFDLHVDTKSNSLKFGISGLAYVNK
jgi:hypothetical protein